MASDSGNVKPNGPEKRLLAGFVEEANADAVLVIWSSTKKSKTSSKVCSWGNHFAVKGMLEWAFETLIGFDEDQELEVSEDIGDDDPDEEDDDDELPR
mgnify:CR=1 FL=1|jgi:hypothetical protein|tara:strand:+ start:1704 stop:1997 length:294 start_codon:yes stop_codon:yes gene_type:complete